MADRWLRLNQLKTFYCSEPSLFRQRQELWKSVVGDTARGTAWRKECGTFDPLSCVGWRWAVDASRTQACSPSARLAHQSRAEEVSEGSVPLDLALRSLDLPEAEHH